MRSINLGAELARQRSRATAGSSYSQCPDTFVDMMPPK